MKADLTESLADLAEYIRCSSGLEAAVGATLAGETAGLVRLLQLGPRPPGALTEAAEGLALLCREGLLTHDLARRAQDLQHLVAGAPRFSALAELTAHVMLRSSHFNQRLWLDCEALSEQLAGVPEGVNFLVTVAALPGQERAMAARRIPVSQARPARARVLQALALACSGASLGIGYADLPELAYDLRAASADLGSLSFSLQSFHGPIHAYRRGGDGAVLLLAAHGTAFDSRGYLFDPATSPEAEAVFVAQLESVAGMVRSNAAVADDGLARTASIRLDPKEWQPVLSPGTDAVEIHVPQRADLSPGRVLTSLQQAIAYYGEHFPECSPRCLFCHTWLLDPQLKGMLAAGSRILGFQRLLQLYPCRYSPEFVLEMVFGPGARGGGPLPLQTSLQRSVAALMARGGHLLEGGGIALIDCGRVERLPDGPQR
jgi:hypothetical protein